ncbi:hypothetical protein RRG08_066760 [Elysia crispata]|uniref:Uncharacterized protein n=1 Tax=Elysia crispata TaxID=231223 RepID=A0AAE0XQL5_9GAST|nr:hypothetical protein RRG08_066760 [Elysia crispata]
MGGALMDEVLSSAGNGRVGSGHGQVLVEEEREKELMELKDRWQNLSRAADSRSNIFDPFLVRLCSLPCCLSLAPGTHLEFAHWNSTNLKEFPLEIKSTSISNEKLKLVISMKCSQ